MRPMFQCSEQGPIRIQRLSAQLVSQGHLPDPGGRPGADGGLVDSMSQAEGRYTAARGTSMVPVLDLVFAVRPGPALANALAFFNR